MRPSRRLLALAGGMLALTVLMIAAPAIPEQAAVLAWGGLAALVLADFALSPGRRGLAVSVAPPAEVYCGETAQVRVTITAERDLPAIAEARAELDEGIGGQASFDIAPGPEGGTGMIPIPARKRGEFRISAVWLRWPSRFGMWEMTPRFPVDATLRVIPNIRPVASGRIDLAMRSELYGLKDIAIRGEGSEFHQLREFTAGMDSRAIDWKRSARHRGLVAKEMRAERNHQIILTLDNGYLMRAEIGGLARIDHAINGALSLAWAAGLGGDLVGLYSYDAEPRRYLPPQPARAAFPRLRSQMAALRYTLVESNHTLALAHLNGRLRRRSLIVIFSDFVDTTAAELLIENLGVLGQAHLILFVTLRDPSMEDRLEGAARDPDAVAEAVVAADMLRERQLVLDRLARLGIICLETAPAELTGRLLSAYLDIKTRELI